MRRTIPLALIACLALAGCSESADDTARDCAAALTSRTGGDPADKPTVSQAEARVDAFDDTLADMVRQGHREIAEEGQFNKLKMAERLGD